MKYRLTMTVKIVGRQPFTCIIDNSSVNDVEAVKSTYFAGMDVIIENLKAVKK